MQHADVAMYLAKGKRTGYEVYEPGAAAPTPRGSSWPASCATRSPRASW